MFCRLLETVLLLTTLRACFSADVKHLRKWMIPCLTKIHSFYLLIGCGGHLGIAFMRVGASSEANFDFWWMSIHESCVSNMMNNFTSPYTLRPTFTQMALRPFVIVFKWLYCPSRDLTGCQNISASEKIVTYI